MTERERERSKVEFSSWNEKERGGRKEERKRGGRASADPGDDGGCDDVHPVPPRVVYRPSLVKCRSAVIYLSRIDASPEVNGRVVTISRRTGQVRAVEDSGVCESRRAREYANIRAVWGLRHGPTRCSLSLGHESPPRLYSLAWTFKLFFDRAARGERPIAIPCALLAWYFHFWWRFVLYGGNDLWAGRFVVGSPSNQGDNRDRSCWCSSFF